MATRPATFDRTNRELRTSRFHFADQPEPVSSIDWRPGLGIGSAIRAEDELATVRYDDGSTERIFAPHWCDGTVELFVGVIDVNQLHSRSELMLSLERASGAS